MKANLSAVCLTDDFGVMLADFWTLLSVLSICLCLLLTIFFIRRLKFDQIFWKLPSTTFPFIPKRQMKKLKNPYVLFFDSLASKEIGDGVDVELTCSYPCHLTALWAVDIDKLHESLLQPSHTLLLELHNREALQETAQQNIEISDVCDRKWFHLNCPSEVKQSGLGESPRRSYPLVLLLSLPVGLSNVEITDSDVVLSVYILHLKDSDCTKTSHVINHFVKLYNGSLLNLQPLFLSSCESDNIKGEGTGQAAEDQVLDRTTGDKQTSNAKTDKRTEDVTPDNDVSQDNIPSDLNETDCCIVCQSSAVSIVLLPCRHTCTCELCFVQVERCPMCRAKISSYFRLSESQPTRWESLNNTINDFLGLNSQHDVH